MPEDLKARFDQAVKDVKTLSQAPDNDVMLKLYGLFKQSTQGDCASKRPGMMDFVGRAKYDAWKALEGTLQDDAMKQYIAVVDGLVAADKK
jgi:acyl-CoA-binding protein